MSGVEVTKKVNENQTNICTSCMNTVVQTFDHFRKQIVNLSNEKTQLLIDIRNLKKEQEKEKRIMSKKIRELEDKLNSFKKV